MHFVASPRELVASNLNYSRAEHGNKRRRAFERARDWLCGFCGAEPGTRRLIAVFHPTYGMTAAAIAQWGKQDKVRPSQGGPL